MNKKLLAVAIASALATPLALADEGNVTISGNLVGAVSSVELNNGDRATDVAPGGSDLSISGQESLGNGLKAVFVLKSWVNITGNYAQGDSQATNNAGDDAGPGALLFGRNKDAYLGLSGSFGTVALGAHGQPYKTATGGLELFGDSIGDARGGITNGQGAFHSGIGDAVMWFLPNMNGFSGHLQVGSENGVNNAAKAWGAQFNYSNGPLYVTYAHADNDAITNATEHKGNKVGVGYSFGDTTINAVAERTKEGTTAIGKISAYSLGLAQKFGANTAKIQYARSNFNPAGTAEDNPRLWAVGLDHNMSKRTKLFAVYADGNNQDTVVGFDDGFQVGMAHSF